MKFKYLARTKEGELQTGNVESFSKEGAANMLTSNGLFILKIESLDQKNVIDRILSPFNRVRLGDLVVFTRQFAMMLESKISLSAALQNLYKQTRSPYLKEVVFDISTDVDSGLALSQALSKKTDVFSEFYVNMIRSAELTGHLEQAMVFLADYLEKSKLWRSRVINALIYPIILVGGFIGVVLLMVTVVFPKIKPIFEESNVALPWFTKMMLGMGDFLLGWWWAVILILIPIIMLAIDYFRTKEGRAVLDETLLGLPIFGGLFRKIYVTQFAESLGVLIRGGIPITQGLIITAHTMSSFIFRHLLEEAAEDVRSGESLSNAILKNEYYFPPMVAQMIAVGETTGRLDEILAKISKFYSAEVEDTLGRLSELIQPAIILIIGVFIGILFASVLLPIYNLIQGFQY